MKKGLIISRKTHNFILYKNEAMNMTMIND